MIARFRLYIGKGIFLQHGIAYPVQEIEQEGYKIKIYAPEQLSDDISNILVTAAASREEPAESLKPDNPQTPTSAVLINDIPALHGNLLTIDFIKDDFDRRRSPPDSWVQADPPLRLVIAVANRIVAGLRTLARSRELRPLTEASAFWRLDYLDDDGQLLPESEELYRMRVIRPYGRQTITALTPLLWERVCGLPSDFVQHTWDALLLDAEALLPDIGPAVAVANAALETFIPWALDQLQRQLLADEKAAVPDSTCQPLQESLKQLKTIYSDTWTYMFNREDWYQEPSISDQLDLFIIMLTQRSLKKEEPRLWEAFSNLRSARHNFIHSGKLVIGKNQNIELTEEKATDLIAKAAAIVGWVEALLPEKARRAIAVENVNFRFTKQFRLPLPMSTPLQDQGTAEAEDHKSGSADVTGK